MSSQKKQYAINSAEEFIEAWIQLSPQLYAQAKELHIVLENEDGTQMDEYLLFVTGETTAEKMKQAGADPKTTEKTLQFASEIQNRTRDLLKKTNPAVTLPKIKEGFAHQHTYRTLQKILEQKEVWLVVASLAWDGYTHDGRGFSISMSCRQCERDILLLRKWKRRVIHCLRVSGNYMTGKKHMIRKRKF